MVSPPELDNGIERFRFRLHGAAHAFLVFNHPDFVKACEAIDSDAAFDAAMEPSFVPVPVQESFARFRELLTLLADVDYMIAHVRPLYRLLSGEPAEQTLTSLGVRLHEWEMIVIQASMITLTGLYERAIKLIPPAVRILTRERDSRVWKPVADQLTADLRARLARVRLLRDGLAHGGDPVSAMNQPGLWEVGSALAYPINVSVAVRQRGDLSVEQRFAAIRSALVEAVAAISRALDGLSERIDWGTAVAPR